MSATTIVRAEFQLIVAGLDFKSVTGVEVKAGTTYGRLYFPEGCELNGSFKGRILKDSWATGAPYSQTRKCRVIEFLATNEVYRTLYNSCSRSNLLTNRNRTHKLLEACFAAPAAVREEVAPVSYATLEWVGSVEELETESIDIVAIAKSRMPVVDNALNTESLVDEVSAFVAEQLVETEYAFILKYAVKTARRLCKNWGIFSSQVPDSLVVEFAALQLQKRNVAPKAIKSFLKPAKKH